MKIIVSEHKHPTVEFAQQELQRLLKKIGVKSTIKGNPSQPGHEQIRLMYASQYNKLVSQENQIDIFADGYMLKKEGRTEWIIGNEPRAILYGVYAYCRNNYGVQFIDLDQELILEPSHKSKKHHKQKPMFARRGNVLETINDPPYIRQLIDWAAKNGLNELFFTFFLWDEVKDEIYEELWKRDFNVTLGGHSLSYLLSLVESQETQEQAEKQPLLFFAENMRLQDKVINKIVEICKESTLVNRISLWPEDVGLDEKSTPDFLATYISFTERLKKALLKNNLSVEVEHIAYNAGLAWNMLERNTDASHEVDVLYAYWGRNYTQCITAIEHERSYNALKDWRKSTSENDQSLTIFEYYSDHFMLSELFPPLQMRIKKDLNDYQQLGMDGMVNLIVPSFAQKYLKEYQDYPWQWIHHFNNYVFTGLSFGEEYEELIERYFGTMKTGDFYRQVFNELEDLVASHTKWNIPLFPARVIDDNKVESSNHTAAIVQYLDNLITFLTPKVALEPTEENKQRRESMMDTYFAYLFKTAKRLHKQWKEKLHE